MKKSLVLLSALTLLTVLPTTTTIKPIYLPTEENFVEIIEYTQPEEKLIVPYCIDDAGTW